MDRRFDIRETQFPSLIVMRTDLLIRHLIFIGNGLGQLYNIINMKLLKSLIHALG